MLITEETVRAGIRVRDGKRVYFLPPGDRLTSGARDYLTAQRIEIIPGAQTPPQTYRLLNGAVLTEKPETMTHLTGNVLVEKSHPRIALRGMIDMLEAEILLCQKTAQSEQKPDICQQLQEILDFVRSLIPCDVLNKPLGEFRLCGMDPAELRERSHHPEKYYGQPHFMPSCRDSLTLLHLNRLRTLIRQTELACCRAFSAPDGQVQREDMILGLNRLSSLLWILIIGQKARENGVGQ